MKGLVFYGFLNWINSDATKILVKTDLPIIMNECYRLGSHVLSANMVDIQEGVR